MDGRVEKTPTSCKHCSGRSSQPHPPQHRGPAEGPPKAGGAKRGGEGRLDDAGSGGDVQREDGIARRTPEPNAALLPAGEERATRCKDKWEPQAPRATGVLAAARLLRVDAPHKTTIPFSWQCPLQRARRGKESTGGAVAGAALGRVHAPSHAPCKFLLMPKVSLCTQNPPKPPSSGGRSSQPSRP